MLKTSKTQISQRVIGTVEPFEKFVDEGCGYKLIESEQEFLEYLNSPYDCNMFCDLKLYRTLKNFDLGLDEIQKKVRIIGRDLRKYKKLVAIMKESKDDKELFEFLFKRTIEEGCVISALAPAPCLA